MTIKHTTKQRKTKSYEDEGKTPLECEGKTHIRFSLSGEVASKKNSRIFNRNTNRLLFSARYNKWYKAALLSIVIQMRDLRERGAVFPIKKCVAFNVTLYHADERRRDSDNQLSSILDLLKDCGAIEDDNNKVIPNMAVMSCCDTTSFCAIDIYL